VAHDFFNGLLIVADTLAGDEVFGAHALHSDSS